MSPYSKNLINVESCCECVVGGNESDTTYLTTAAVNNTYETTKTVERWASEG
jgi:hypothetical protein